MMRRIIVLGFAVVITTAVLLASSVQAQHSKKPQLARAVYWANADAEIYLLEKASGGLRLTIVSKKRFKVFYHTRINSIEPVDRELVSLTSSNGFTTYDFEHHFTKMTIWMALEFSFDGKVVPELTRTFLNDINEVVANDYFDFGTKPKLKS